MGFHSGAAAIPDAKNSPFPSGSAVVSAQCPQQQAQVLRYHMLTKNVQKVNE